MHRMFLAGVVSKSLTLADVIVPNNNFKGV